MRGGAEGGGGGPFRLPVLRPHQPSLTRTRAHHTHPPLSLSQMSVIMGITQMTFGLLLKVSNALYFKSSTDLWLEAVPQVVFMIALFGYMVRRGARARQWRREEGGGGRGGGGRRAPLHCMSALPALRMTHPLPTLATHRTLSPHHTSSPCRCSSSS